MAYGSDDNDFDEELQAGHVNKQAIANKPPAYVAPLNSVVQSLMRNYVRKQVEPGSYMPYTSAAPSNVLQPFYAMDRYRTYGVPFTGMTPKANYGNPYAAMFSQAPDSGTSNY